MKHIEIYGAKEHNLKNVSLKIPRDQLTVITGLSGSGKSSLAFDTIYAEGQRRYVESLSSYARQFLEKMKKPEVDKIAGLSPSISIEQKHITKNPRSTVGTITELYDYLRLLFAKIGVIHCYQCSEPISNLPFDQIYQRVLDLEKESRLIILAPIVRERKGEFKDVFAKIKKQGYSKVQVDGTIFDLRDTLKLQKSKKHDIDIVIDRVILEKENHEQIKQSLKEALRLGEETCLVEVLPPEGKSSKKKQVMTFSQKLYCTNCNIGYETLNPNHFSFNSSIGSCGKCHGIGKVALLLEDFVIKDPTKPLLKGALNKEIFFSFNRDFINELVHGLQEQYGFDVKTPFEALSEEAKEAFFWGNQEYYGISDELKELLHKTDSTRVKNKIKKFLKEETCPVCKGTRLNPKYQGVRIAKKNISELAELSIQALEEYFSKIKLTAKEKKLSEEIIKEINIRLNALLEMGLSYLNLSRPASTLSGGEVQRVRLASQIGTGLSGVLYVLDEPSIGLHPRDNIRLLNLLKKIKDLKNTILVVEHDEETMLKSDFLIDLGPRAGENGGEVVLAVPKEKFKTASDTKSITLQYLRGKKQIQIPESRIKPDHKHVLKIKDVRANNLKRVTVQIPLGLFVCITGVSGSGKSTLIHDVLYKSLHNHFWKTDYEVGKHKAIDGIENIDKVIEIDQAPIGRTSRSNPATYLDIFGPLRRLFSQLPEAKIKGYTPSHFSFNLKGGRCDKCEGQGSQKMEMSFLPDVYVQCDVCRGKRFKQDILTISYRGKNIHDVLSMTVDDAVQFFDSIPKVQERLQVLQDVGLGYIRLGQSSTTLSGGEAQRIKIGYELTKKATGKTLYILDEPTTGLHFADIEHLMKALLKLREAGNSIIVIEHNLDVIKMADHIIDLGPEGGEAGGKIIAKGTPEQVAANSKSYTGKYLKKVL